MFRALKLIFPALLLLLVDVAPIFAQEAAYHVVNRWRNTVIAATGSSATEQSNNGLPMNQWFIENADEGTVRFRSATTGDYLYYNGVGLAVGPVPPTARDAMWRLEPVDDGHSRISNLAQPSIYLHTQPEYLEASPMEPNWWSAMWRLEQVSVAQAANNSNNTQIGNAVSTGSQTALDLGARPQQPQQRQQGLTQQPVKAGTPNAGLNQQANGYARLPPPPRAASTRFAGTQAGQSVKVFVQNRSNFDLDIFVDDDNGEQVFLATLRPNQQLEQATPVGLIWRLAQNDVWLDAYQIEPGSAEQVIVFP